MFGVCVCWMGPHDPDCQWSCGLSQASIISPSLYGSTPAALKNISYCFIFGRWRLNTHSTLNTGHHHPPPPSSAASPYSDPHGSSWTRRAGGEGGGVCVCMGGGVVGGRRNTKKSVKTTRKVLRSERTADCKSRAVSQRSGQTDRQT